MKFMEACQAENRLEALRLEAMEIAVWSGGNMNHIRDLWHGKQGQPGLKPRMILLLRQPDVARELQGREAYYLCYEGLWQAVCSTRGV